MTIVTQSTLDCIVACVSSDGKVEEDGDMFYM